MIENSLHLNHSEAGMKLVIQGGVLGGFILFLWSIISWMVLPFHSSNLRAFQNETLVESALMASLDNGKGGVYILPNPKGPFYKTKESKKQAQLKMQHGPSAFIVMNPQGGGSMPKDMILAFLLNVLSAMLVTGLLFKTAGMSYWGRVGFVVLVAVTAGVIVHLPEWNWWGFTLGFIGAEFIDLIAGWFLAGLVIAKVTK
jgi:hypothetical protein